MTVSSVESSMKHIAVLTVTVRDGSQWQQIQNLSESPLHVNALIDLAHLSVDT